MKAQITVLPAQDALKTLSTMESRVTTTIIDPWYNKGVGGVRTDYDEWLLRLVALSADCSHHVFVWGFPEIVHKVLDHMPQSFSLLAWLTWYYKNCPSVIRGWRSAQYACLHLSRNNAKVYPEHFLNDAQTERQRAGRLRYMPGPASVIECPLNIGFIGRHEQTGHPAQKPEKVFEPLVLMTTRPGDTVLDPFCGSGTTGAVCKKLGRRAILCDDSPDYVELTRKRLAKIKSSPTVQVVAKEVV